jgi:3-dehydroquinate synthase
VSATTRIAVSGEPAGYEVWVGSGIIGEVPGILGESVRRVLVVHPEGLAALGQPVRDLLQHSGFETHLAQLPDAESAKTIGVAAGLWTVLGQAGFTRTDAVVAVGGGSTTDLAGFVAATWLRGVPVVQVPTTLLGMVDAAVGGKTGINTAEGKNLVGSFHPPRAVLCDIDTLKSLPHRDFVAGLAEVVKCGFVADPEILTLIERDPVGASAWDSPLVRDLVERSVRVKAEVVSADLREASLREVLNYGHTFGHAIEQVEGYTWRHGEAVSVGLVYAAELARLAGRLDGDVADRHREVLRLLGLPTTYAAGRWDALYDAMRRDKKTRGDLLRFVVLDGLARPGRLEGPSLSMLQAAYDAVSAAAPTA